MVFVPESNLALEGQHIASRIQKLKHDVILMYEDMNRVGIRTSNRLKQIMAFEHSQCLKNGKSKFHKSFFTCNDDIDIAVLKDEMCRQYTDYECERKESRDPNAEPRYIFSGKRNGKPDDIVIAHQLNYVMHRIFMTSNDYAKFRNN